MSAARDIHRMSVEAYLALEAASPDNRYEYLDGRISMMSGGTRKHALISANIIALLIQTSPCLVFTSDARVKLNDARYVYPDVSVSCVQQSPDDEQNVTEPALVVEVLSQSTAAYDRGEKLQRYRECPSLTTIILVSQEQPAIEVLRRQSTDIWTIQTYGLSDEIIIDAISARLPVAAIYRNIAFVSA